MGELNSLKQLLQEQYADCLMMDDMDGLLETSGTLSLVFTVTDQAELACRWARQYLQHLLVL